MKPEFALSLSLDGIGLLMRGQEGWLRVGDVALDVADLDAELSDLRRAALGLAPGGFTTMLVIPDSQIRYLEIETGDVDDPTRQAMIRHALDGATPYAVEELLFDWTVDGSVTQVAAVARETLEEAEAFAVQHRFNPVCFVATPERSGFGREVFFGETASAELFLPAGTSVEPDTARMEVVGSAPPPAPFAEEVEEEESATAPEAPGPPADETTADAALADASGGAQTGSVEASAAAPEEEKADAPEPKGEQADATPHEDVAAEPPSASGRPADDRKGEEKEEAPAQFFSIRARRGAPSPSPDDATGTPPVLPSFRSAGRAQGDAAEARPAPQLRGASAPAPRIPKAPAPRIGAPAGDMSDDPTPARTAPLPPRAPDLGRAARRTGEEDAPPLRTAGPGIASAQPAASLGQHMAPPEDEAERLTLFGARGEQKVGGKPRYLGLMLTAALLVFLVGVAAWAAVFVDDGLARFFPDRSERAVAGLTEPEAAPETEAEPAPSAVAEEPVAPGTPAAEDAAPPPPEETAARAPETPPAPTPLPEPEPEPQARRAVTPEEAEARYAVTGIWQMAPERPGLPDLIPLDGLVLAAVEDTPPKLEALSLPLPEAARGDAAPPQQPPAPPPGTVFRLDEDGNILPTPEGSYSPLGITIYEGPPPVVPPRRDGAAEAPEAESEAETAPADDAADTGLIFGPSLDGIAAEGPPVRPGALAEESDAATVEEPMPGEEAGPESALAAFRPLARPGAVTAAAEASAAAAEAEALAEAQSAAEGAAADALAEAQRTADDAAAATAAASTAGVAATTPSPDAPDLSSATRLAVVASIAPEARPGNFGRTVARAQPEPTRVASVAPRSVAPPAPSNTTVAREATLDNAINLRRLNLIGVYGQPSNRRALVRLSNGRYLKVEVGDRLDGGRVSAIGEGELRYTKNGRSRVLRMPSG